MDMYGGISKPEMEVILLHQADPPQLNYSSLSDCVLLLTHHPHLDGHEVIEETQSC